MSKKIKDSDIKYLHFYSGYAGKVGCRVLLKGEEEQEHLIEVDQLITLIEDKLKAGDYEIEKTPRQKYPRITLK